MKHIVKIQVILSVNLTPDLLMRIAAQMRRTAIADTISDIAKGACRQWQFSVCNEFHFQYPPVENAGSIILDCTPKNYTPSGAQLRRAKNLH